VARAHFGLAAGLGLDWLHAAIGALPASGGWGSAARSRLQSVCLAAHLRLTASALESPRHSHRIARRTVAQAALEHWEQVQRDLKTLATPDLAALTVAVEALEGLAATRGAGHLG
jgi:NAD-specific glutamate dehydrogenase